MYLFGYKQGVDFARLPKVQITILPDGCLHVLVNHELVEDSGVTLISDKSRIILRVPLKLFGGTDLDHLFVSALTYLGVTVADDISWHLLRLQPATKSWGLLLQDLTSPSSP